jgi:arylsulfate sulfotransferase
MTKKVVILRISGIALVLILLGMGLYRYYAHSITIKSIKLQSPNNYAFQEDIIIDLDKEASIEVKYWRDGSAEKFLTITTKKGLSHKVNLLLLETNTTYKYQVVIKRLVPVYSNVLSFQTRKQSPWLEHNWVDTDHSNDRTALNSGLVLLCNARLPGYIAMVDGKGAIRWYWQVDDIGVRAATITPRGTILAMLRPPMKDVIDDTPMQQAAILREVEKPIRRGAMGFAGGTAIAEIDPAGKMLWRIDIDKAAGGKYKIIHHDVRMDKNGHICTLIRNTKLFDMTAVGGAGIDTLGGDGILVIDTTGKELWTWSVWDVWDITKDPYIKRFAYDRFHINSLNFDKDGNYLVSVAIEDQIWKISAKTGKLMWKLGKYGDFKMDTTCYFSFQHSVNINSEGDLMVFDNSLWAKVSGAVSFYMDTVNMIAKTKIKALLPRSKYTSRMGSAYLLPNGNLLQTSSKTGTVMVTDKLGKILWELNSYFVPYRAEYVPASFWKNYFIRD